MTTSSATTRLFQRLFGGNVGPVVLLTGLALVVRLPGFDHVAWFDELYHVFAARNWLVEGEFRIGEGTYSRASLFTVLTAFFFAGFGESLEVARLPSLLAGTALVPIVFLWVRREADGRAAWLAAILLGLSAEAIEISQFARFYALHGLLFWLAAIGTYELVLRPGGAVRTSLLGLAILTACASALHFQITTLIGLAGLGCWIVLVRGAPLLAKSPLGWVWGLLTVLAALVVVLLVLQSELGQWLLDLYLVAPLWTQENQGMFWYYHRYFLINYPSIWPLTALAVIIGLSYRPKPVVFCACIFTIIFAFQSFGAVKGPRIIYYAMPFLFVLWAVAISCIWPALQRGLHEVVEGALHALGIRRALRPLMWGVLALIFTSVVFANLASLKTVTKVAGLTLPGQESRGDWRAAADELTPWLAEADVVMSTEELMALYYLGRHDVLVSNSRLAETAEGTEFTIDHRTGHPIVSTPESVGLIVDCYEDGLIVSSESHWRIPWALNDEVADFIEAHTERLRLNAQGIHAYVWQHPSRDPAACERLPVPIR